MSRILSTISMLTGQISSQARHVVHAHSSSAVIRSKTLSDVTVIALSTDTGGETGSAAVRSATSPSLMTISRGSSGLPVVLAGHTEVQRPQMVQASVSKSCFQVNSPTVAAPMVSMSVASIRLGTARIAPFGRGWGERYMLTGDETMCRSLVVGSITRNTMNTTTWEIQNT